MVQDLTDLLDNSSSLVSAVRFNTVENARAATQLHLHRFHTFRLNLEVRSMGKWHAAWAIEWNGCLLQIGLRNQQLQSVGHENGHAAFSPRFQMELEDFLQSPP